jgi:hypothetical protein
LAKRFLVDLDLSTNELQNAVIQNASADPSGVAGRIYFNDTTNFLKFYDGSTWQNIATGTGATNAISLAGDLTGNASAVGGIITLSATIAANSVELGTDTTGNYVASVVSGSYITLSNNGGESATPTIAVDATSASTVSKVVARDSSGDIYVRNVYGTLIGTADHANTASAINFSGITDKPDPTVAIYLSGDISGNGSTTLTDLASGSITISTAITADSITLGTDTTGNYVAGVTASTGVIVNGTPGEGWTPVISIGQPVANTDSPVFADLTLTGDIAVNGGDITTTSIAGNIFQQNASAVYIGGAAKVIGIGSASGTTTINNNLVVSGDLTVSGSITTLNTSQLFVEDNTIVLNSNVTDSPTLDAGVEVERGTSTNVSLLWNETDDQWTLTNNGTSYHAIARKSSHAITGNSSSTSFILAHGLGTRDVAVDVYADSSPYDTVEVDIERNSTASVTIRFSIAPNIGTNYRAVVIG